MSSENEKRWDDLVGCERLIKGARVNLHLVVPVLIVTAVCSAGVVVEHYYPQLRVPLRVATWALVAYGCYQLWTAAIGLSEKCARPTGPVAVPAVPVAAAGAAAAEDSDEEGAAGGGDQKAHREAAKKAHSEKVKQARMNERRIAKEMEEARRNAVAPHALTDEQLQELWQKPSASEAPAPSSAPTGTPGRGGKGKRA